MLVLSLKKGSKVQIGSKVLLVEAVHENAIYVNYAGAQQRVGTDTTSIDFDTTAKFIRLRGGMARIGFISPNKIWRKKNVERAVSRRSNPIPD